MLIRPWYFPNFIFQNGPSPQISPGIIYKESRYEGRRWQIVVELRGKGLVPNWYPPTDEFLFVICSVMHILTIDQYMMPTNILNETGHLYEEKGDRVDPM